MSYTKRAWSLMHDHGLTEAEAYEIVRREREADERATEQAHARLRETSPECAEEQEASV